MSKYITSTTKVKIYVLIVHVEEVNNPKRTVALNAMGEHTVSDSLVCAVGCQTVSIANDMCRHNPDFI